MWIVDKCGDGIDVCVVWNPFRLVRYHHFDFSISNNCHFVWGPSVLALLELESTRGFNARWKLLHRTTPVPLDRAGVGLCGRGLFQTSPRSISIAMFLFRCPYVIIRQLLLLIFFFCLQKIAPHTFIQIFQIFIPLRSQLAGTFLFSIQIKYKNWQDQSSIIIFTTKPTFLFQGYWYSTWFAWYHTALL